MTIPVRNLLTDAILIGLSAMLLQSCTKDSGPVTVYPEFTLETNDTVSFSNFILPVIQKKCWFCHPPSGNLDMGFDSAYFNLVDVESSGYAPDYRVVPFDTSASVLYHKIMGDGVFNLQMPPGGGGDTLSIDQKNLFATWIMQGALNN